jgi:hypothetical protein
MWTLLAAPASGAAAACGGPVDALAKRVAALGPKATTEQKAAPLTAAVKAHPECRDALVRVIRRPAPPPKGTPFLGPVGWLWNTIYYRVFQGNDVMMAMFGWEIYLSPIILVLAWRAVRRGIGAATRKPKPGDFLNADA